MNIPATMQAAILVEQHQPLVVDEVQLPRQLHYGQVLVEIRFSGICGSQLGEIDGAKGPDAYLPHLLGHEGAGTVLEVGPGVKRVRPGERVVLHWMKAPGIEAEVPAYQWRGRSLNAGWITTFNEYAIVSENRVTPIPAEVPLDVAALFGCAVTTGLGVIVNNARLTIGESITILGAGGVGLNMVQGAAMVSAYPIIAVDRFESKLALAREMGATHLLNASQEGWEDELRQITGPQGADVIVDNTGLPALIELAYRLTQPQGRVVLVGVPRAGQAASFYTLPLHFGKTLTGSHGGECQPSRDIPRYIQLLLAGKLRLADLITDRFGLEDINEAINQMRQGDIVGRCLIQMHKGDNL